jgi:dipeptidyl aminopeptidase/acylaminoacyl peptidase
MTSRLPRVLILGVLLLAVSSPAPSQAPAIRPIQHSDYAAWRSIQAPVLSPDGTVIAYALAPQEGDGEFVARILSTGKEYRHPRGSRPGGMETPQAPRPGLGRGRGAALVASPHQFLPDSKFVAFTIYPPRPEKGKGKAAPAVNALGLMSVADGKVTRIDRVQNYRIPEEGPAVLVYRKYPAAAVAAADASKGGAPKGRRFPQSTPGAQGGAAPPQQGTELVLRNLADGKERTFADITEYTLTKDGKWLVYAVAGKEQTGGVYAVTLGRETPPLVIRSGPGRYSRLTWDEKQTQLVFFQRQTPTPPPAGATAATNTRPVVRIGHWKPPASVARTVLLPSPTARLAAPLLTALQAGLPAASDLVPAGKPALQTGYEFSDQGELSFSPDGTRVYFGVSAPPPPPAKSAAPGEEKAVVELWHYRDDFVQPMQKVRYSASRTYRAVFHLDDRSCRQLTDETLSNVQPAAAGDWALALDDRAYRTLVGGSEASAPVDVLLINARTGVRKSLVKKQSFPPSLSPGGKYLLYYDGKDWNTLSVPDGKHANLTATLGVSFANELFDAPSTAPPYGLAGWTKDDKHVLLHDRYDVWMIAPDGSSAKNLTAGLGRKTTSQLRVVRVDFAERSFDPAKPLLVRADNETTRNTGFYRVSFSGGDPKLLIMGARNYGTPFKARKADAMFLNISTFYDYPDLYIADSDFREIRRVSDANPQKRNFVWGKSSLVRYKNADGVPLSGILIKPENFNPNKKYPMIVYIYERLSQNLHRFVDPQPGTSINASYYASNGYLVLMPDITYTIGYPGQSALKCVLPAIQAVVDQGCVNEKAIGIQGHSWGGYQTAYMITQTTRFKAAAAGAPVSNMTSAYGGIRWSTGLPRQFQYEKSQSRIGGSLWQYPTRFLENSPIFQADRIQTPLMMLHNDRDGAVPWYQGIEYYLALRRLGKEVYLFNYVGEDHGLRRRVNQADYTVRMQQFFDHHLKGAPKPEWMEKGIAYTPPPGGTTEGASPARTGGRRPRTQR